MKLYSWNVNGIRAVLKKDALLPFIETEQPDILCLQEIKANREQVEFELPGYFQHWNSADKKGYSGTVIFSKTKPLSTINGYLDSINKKYDFVDKYGDTSKEGRVISAEFDDFWVVTVYTPNSKGDLSRLKLRHKKWDPAFLEHVKELEKSKPVLFCGDLNVAHTPDDLANPKSNIGKHGFTDEERGGVDNILANDFVDTFRTFTNGNGHYSWWSHFANSRANNRGWRIDYWFASKSINERITSAKIHPNVLGSDHCPVSIELL